MTKKIVTSMNSTIIIIVFFHNFLKLRAHFGFKGDN